MKFNGQHTEGLSEVMDAARDQYLWCVSEEERKLFPGRDPINCKPTAIFKEKGKKPDTNEDPDLSRLFALVGPVSKPPLLQPANSLRLTRDIKQVFDSKQDTLPQLLSTFKPIIAPEIYSAWANAAVAETSQLQVYALRVKAAPFRNNAPLKQITDSKHKPIGSVEWPLAGSTTFSVIWSTITNLISFAASSGPIYRATVSMERDDNTYSDSRILDFIKDEGEPVTLGDGNVKIMPIVNKDGGRIGYSFEFQINKTTAKIVIYEPIREVAKSESR
jgi:hypothetical protein